MARNGKILIIDRATLALTPELKSRYRRRNSVEMSTGKRQMRQFEVRQRPAVTESTNGSFRLDFENERLAGDLG
jgi:hypothetical protein